MPSQKFGMCREAFPKDREGSGGPPRGLRGVGSPSLSSRMGREALPESRRVGRPSQRSRKIGRPSHRSKMGREAFWEVQEGSGGPSRGPGEVGRPSQRSGRGQEALLEVREALPEGLVGREAN